MDSRLSQVDRLLAGVDESGDVSRELSLAQKAVDYEDPPTLRWLAACAAAYAAEVEERGA